MQIRFDLRRHHGLIQFPIGELIQFPSIAVRIEDDVMRCCD